MNRSYLLSLFKEKKKQYRQYQNMKLETFQVSFMHQWICTELGTGGGTVFAPHVFLYQMANTITAQVHSHKPSDVTSSSSRHDAAL